MNEGKNYSFRLSGLYMRMLKRIMRDLPPDQSRSPTLTMKQVISDYVIMKYGEDEHKEIRRKFIEDTLQ